MSSAQLKQEELALWPQDRRPAVYGVCATMLVLSNTAVPGRLWAQYKIHRKIFIEDYFLVAALLFTNIVNITTIIAGTKGLGLHTWRVVADDPSYNNLVGVFASIWVTALFTGPSLFSTKIALLTYYRRLFIVNQTWIRIFWWINLVFATMWGIGSTLFYIFQCSPVEYYWARGNPNSGATGHCADSGSLAAVATPQILSMVSDFFILLLPILTILGLKMDMKRRLGLMAVFSVGFVSFGCSAARIGVALGGTEMVGDDTWSLTIFEIISATELTSGILCASAVPIFSYLRLTIRGASTQNSQSSFGFKEMPSPVRRRDQHDPLASTSEEHLRDEYTTNDKLNV
ncbi:hypothetical protein N7478_002000 [Penicillium angulare]|uniref:uncharacterized protein n=1 Tax=Penicillium angulare TaxID=116970 RepID=UPI00254120A4|nr:uncharacterized protein N7478_002000 [Penicillium angulare]KAJ5288970.1 hypothetical protein N7478_002000 [Penicillium angulare]